MSILPWAPHQPHPNRQSCPYFLSQVQSWVCPFIGGLDFSVMHPGKLLQIWFSQPIWLPHQELPRQFCARSRSQRPHIFSLALNLLVISGNKNTLNRMWSWFCVTKLPRNTLNEIRRAPLSSSVWDVLAIPSSHLAATSLQSPPILPASRHPGLEIQTPRM